MDSVISVKIAAIFFRNWIHVTIDGRCDHVVISLLAQ